MSQSRRALNFLKTRIKNILGWISSIISLIFYDWRHLRILLINYTGKEGNHGCIATSRSLVNLIKKKYPKCVIHFQPISYIPPKKVIPFYIKEIDDFLPEFISAEKKRFRFFNWAHIIIFNGEGSVHEYYNMKADQSCLSRLLQIYAAKKIYNKKVFAVNQTIDYKNGNFGRFIKKCYEGLDYISVREVNSFDKAHSLGLEHVKQAADAAFLLSRGNDQKGLKFLHRKGVRPGLVCIFLSETISRCDTSKTIDLIKKIREILNKDILICATTKVDISHVKEIRKSINIPTIGLEVSPEDLISILTYADVVLSGRFHCCIFSFLASVPLLPFRSNTYKVEGLVKLMNYPVKVHDYSEDSNNSIIYEIQKILCSAGDLKRRIKEEMPRVRKLSQLNIV